MCSLRRSRMGAPAGLRYEENAASHHRQRLPLAFPGFFVHHTREQTERRRRGVPSHTWVEVMRISRIADQDRKWAQADLSTIGQVWFFLSPGSGIWWNTGRSLVINRTVSTETTLWDRVRATLRGGRRTISPLSATACTSPAQVNMWWARRNAEFRLATCTRARRRLRQHATHFELLRLLIRTGRLPWRRAFRRRADMDVRMPADTYSAYVRAPDAARGTRPRACLRASICMLVCRSPLLSKLRRTQSGTPWPIIATPSRCKCGRAGWSSSSLPWPCVPGGKAGRRLQ